MSRQAHILENSKRLLLSAVGIVALCAIPANVKPAVVYATPINRVANKKAATKTLGLKASSTTKLADGKTYIFASPSTKKKTKPQVAITASETLVLNAASDKIGDLTTAEKPATFVTAHYQDRTGKTLAPDKILTGKPGERYATSAINIHGYVLATVPANATGTFTGENQNVIYTYDIKGAIVDQDSIAIGVNEKKIPVVASSPDLENSGAAAKSKASITTHSVTSEENSHKTNFTANELPQTNNSAKIQPTILGLGSLSLFGSLLGAWRIRKK